MTNLPNMPNNVAVLSQRNIRRKKEKFFKKQLGNDFSKEELNKMVAAKEIQVIGLITKR